MPKPHPKPTRPTPARLQTLSNQLRGIIEGRGLTAYAVGQLADVDPGVVSRFLTGARDIRMGTADRIASALGLRLVELARPTRGRSPRPVAAEPGSDPTPAV